MFNHTGGGVFAITRMIQLSDSAIELAARRMPMVAHLRLSPIRFLTRNMPMPMNWVGSGQSPIVRG